MNVSFGSRESDLVAAEKLTWLSRKVGKSNEGYHLLCIQMLSLWLGKVKETFPLLYM